MSSQDNKPSKKIKNSDSDYKAQDQGSASDNQSWRKYRKAPYNLKLSKKQVIESNIKTLLPMGVHLKFDNKQTKQEYEQLLNVTEAEQFSLNFKSVLGKVIEVIDGECYRIAVSNNGKIIKANFKLHGVSVPDLKKSEAKDFANYVKKIVKEMIEGKVVRIQTGEYDKLGRISSRIFVYTVSPLALSIYHSKSCPEFCINDYLIQHDMAKGVQNKNKNQFSKKDFQQFSEKYENKNWPTTENYPLQVFKTLVHEDYEQKSQQDDA